jgi:chemotaxis protein MotA
MLDLLTIAGLAAGLVLISIGIIIGSGPDGVAGLMIFIDIPSAFITFGGSLCALLVNFSWKELKSLIAVVKVAFTQPQQSPLALVRDFKRYAEIARRDGVLALDNVTGEIKDPFLARGVQLAVDGTDPDVIEHMLNSELESISGRHEVGVRVLKQLATYAPAFGMIGTLIGLVIMLKNLNSPERIGPSMAVAIITTFYGAMLTYLVASPLADKLEMRNNDEILLKQMVIKGIISIQAGDNPRMVEQKLLLFLPQKIRKALA